MVPLPRSLEALGEREFRVLFIGQAVSLLGDGMVNVALAFAVLDLTGSASALGLVLAARLVPLVGFLLAGGVLADRLPRRAVMLVADVVRFASQGAMAALLIADEAHVWELAALSAVTGSAAAFLNPASTGLMPAVVSPGRLQQANALRGLAMAGGQIAGPAVAGVLVATLALTACTLPLALLALELPAAIIAAVALLSGAGVMISNTVWETTLQQHVPPAALSRVSSYDWFGSLAFQPLGFAVWGPVADTVGVAPALWSAFAIQLLAIAALRAVPSIRELRGGPPHEPVPATA